MKVFDGWHHFAKVVDKFGNKSLYLDGQLGSYLPKLCFDEVRVSNIDRYCNVGGQMKVKLSEKLEPPYTIDFWMKINFSLKHWSYAQKWSFAQVCVRKK